MPSPDAFEGFHQIDVIPFEEGVITTYESTTPAVLDKRQCGANDVRCDGSNVPSSASCLALINYLRSNSGSRFGSQIRSFCYTSGNAGQCYASWNRNVPSGALYGNLQPAATAVRNQYVNQGRSGYALNVNLRGVCLTQCLSNRPTGC